MVPGLADSAGVSFESVNRPGNYLRHSGYVAGLAANDYTALLQADATFYRTAGLADSSWSSFRSYNFPDRYLCTATTCCASTPQREFAGDGPPERHLPRVTS
ncbi:AbfB domain-containing protein [Micromonospora wenchangensis]